MRTLTGACRRTATGVPPAIAGLTSPRRVLLTAEPMRELELLRNCLTSHDSLINRPELKVVKQVSEMQWGQGDAVIDKDTFTSTIKELADDLLQCYHMSMQSGMNVRSRVLPSKVKFRMSVNHPYSHALDGLHMRAIVDETDLARLHISMCKRRLPFVLLRKPHRTEHDTSAVEINPAQRSP